MKILNADNNKEIYKLGKKVRNQLMDLKDINL